MDSFNSERPSSSQSKPPHLFLQQALTDFQTHCSTFFQNHHQQNHHPRHFLFNIPPFDPNFKTHVDSALSNLHHHAKQAIESGFSKFGFNPGSPVKANKSSSWARIAEKNSDVAPGGSSGLNASSSNGSTGAAAMAVEAIEERLAGVPVYALSNSSDEFVLVSGVDNGKSLGLFCFKEEDAGALLEQMKSMDPAMREGSKVVAVALNKVFQLQLDGVSFRLIPEVSQVKNAIKEKRKAGSTEGDFLGVPVFQSRSLILRSHNKRYRPVFFRKEDLEKSLLRASRHQGRLNPSFKEGDIQVAVLEEIIQGMKDDTTSTWDDVVFIPPGFDVSTETSQK